MVRIQRFALAFMLIGSFVLSGCANSRNKLASLLGRGTDDAFSDSIVDNRELPKSAKEMADSVQDSLKDTKSKVADTTDAIASTTKKRYTKSAKKLDSIDTRIDDVIARAKTRGKAIPPKKSKSNFPEDPFLEEFDALADKPVRVAEKAKNSVFDQLDDAKKTMADSRDAFGSKANDIAEPLISTVSSKTNKFADKFDETFDSRPSDFGDTGGPNPFEELDDNLNDVVSDHTANLDKLDEPVATFAKESNAFDDSIDDVMSDALETMKSDFEDLGDPGDSQTVAEKMAEPVNEIVTALTPSKQMAKQVREPVAVDASEQDEFDLLFAEAGPSRKTPKRAVKENQFRHASALRAAKQVEKTALKNPPIEPTAPRVDPRFGTDFDRMIVDSDKLPQRSIPDQQQVTKSKADDTDDQFTGVKNQLSTYDDFFEADNTVRANQPREASRESNPFSFVEPDRESQPAAIPVEPTPSVQPEPAPMEEPAPVSPFEEFDEFDETEEFDDNLPVAQDTVEPTAPTQSKQPMRLVSMPSVVRVSGNTAADLTNRTQQAVEPPTFELAETASEFDRTPPAELPNIVPGQKSEFSNEPFIDLSAVTQTPLENVAWEVESQSTISSGSTGTSPWIAWIAVALCSIALILLLRPATNRIS